MVLGVLLSLFNWNYRSVVKIEWTLDSITWSARFTRGWDLPTTTTARIRQKNPSSQIRFNILLAPDRNVTKATIRRSYSSRTTPHRRVGNHIQQLETSPRRCGASHERDQQLRQIMELFGMLDKNGDGLRRDWYKSLSENHPRTIGWKTGNSFEPKHLYFRSIDTSRMLPMHCAEFRVQT